MDSIETYINESIEKDDSIIFESTPASDVWIISQIECDCDINGIDTFINRFNQQGLNKAMNAYFNIGAIEISNSINDLINSIDSDELRDKVNCLITDRCNYSYQDIYNFVKNKITN